MFPLPLCFSAAAVLATIGSLTFFTKAASAQAPVLKMDFTSQNIPGDTTVGTSQPYSQNGLRLTPNTTGSGPSIVFHGSNSSNWTGVRSIRPSAHPNTLRLEVPGRRFSMRSIRLHPAPVGAASNIVFNAAYGNGGFWTTSGSTGSTAAGNLVSFDSHFDNINQLFWTFDFQPGNGLLNNHHISEITVVLVPVLTMRPAFTVNEAAGTLTIPIGLSSSWHTAVSVGYSIGSGTATVTSDYTLPGNTSSGTLTIPAGDTSVPLTIPIVNDSVMESPETFNVVLSNPTFGFLLPGSGATHTGTVTIASDDGITNFADWMAAHALTGNDALTDADPNRDGITNLESWLCRLNPAGPNSDTWLARRPSWFTTATHQPALRLTAPLPLPADVRLIFEESTGLSTWSEQTRRSGFGVGSLWTGPGASRVVESNTITARTLTFPGSQTITSRPKTFLRMKYELFNPGGSD